MKAQASPHPSFIIPQSSCPVRPPCRAGFRLARGEAFEARAAQTALVTRAQLRPSLLTQFNLTTPAARERRAADELAAARLARRRLAPGRRDEGGELS